MRNKIIAFTDQTNYENSLNEYIKKVFISVILKTPTSVLHNPFIFNNRLLGSMRILASKKLDEKTSYELSQEEKDKIIQNPVLLAKYLYQDETEINKLIENFSLQKTYIIQKIKENAPESVRARLISEKGKYYNDILKNLTDYLETIKNKITPEKKAEYQDLLSNVEVVAEIINSRISSLNKRTSNKSLQKQLDLLTKRLNEFEAIKKGLNILITSKDGILSDDDILKLKEIAKTRLDRFEDKEIREIFNSEATKQYISNFIKGLDEYAQGFKKLRSDFGKNKFEEFQNLIFNVQTSLDVIIEKRVHLQEIKNKLIARMSSEKKKIMESNLTETDKKMHIKQIKAYYQPALKNITRALNELDSLLTKSQSLHKEVFNFYLSNVDRLLSSQTTTETSRDGMNFNVNPLRKYIDSLKAYLANLEISNKTSQNEIEEERKNLGIIKKILEEINSIINQDIFINPAISGI